jgi:hypothetical protein
VTPPPDDPGNPTTPTVEAVAEPNPAAKATPAIAEPGDAAATLPFTGGDPEALLTAAMGLIGAGAVLTRTRRRRALR